MIPQEELDRFMRALNQSIQKTGPFDGNEREIPEGAIFAMFHGYLFVAKKHNMPAAEYEIIRKALQDITNWITIGMDIEKFRMSDSNLENHVLLEI